MSAKIFLAPITANTANKTFASAIDGAIQIKMCGSGAGVVRARRGITIFISNEDMDDITGITNSLENSNVLLDGVTKTVKHEMKKEGGFLGVLIAPFAVSVLQVC